MDMKFQQRSKDELHGNLDGKRILVVEDSPVVADDTEQMLGEVGCFVVGPATTMADARQLAEKEQIDAAIVDINIRGGKAFPILQILAERGIPFVVASGYADWTMPEEWQDRPRLGKPYNPLMLREKLVELIGERSDDA